jgi:hypothetical protein
MILVRTMSSAPSGSVLGDEAICDMKTKTAPHKSGNIGYPTSSVAQANLTIKINFNILRSFSSSDILTIYLRAFLQSLHPFEKNCVQGLLRDFRQNNPNTNKKFR